MSLWHTKLLPLPEPEWKLIVNAIGPVVNQTRLPDNRSLREGFRLAISLALIEAAEPSVAQRHAETRHFVQIVSKAFERMSPKTREEWNDESGADFLRTFSHCVDLVFEEHLSIYRDKDDDKGLLFLPDVVWLLVNQCAIAKTLPGNAWPERANQYELVRGARAAVKVALAVAERHQPSAVPGLRRIIRSNSVLIRRLRQALKVCGYLQIEYDSRSG